MLESMKVVSFCHVLQGPACTQYLGDMGADIVKIEPIAGERGKAVGSAILDQHGGALLAMGIVAAYVKKLTTGQGSLVESSLYAAGLDIQTEPLTVYMTQRPGQEVFEREEHLATWYHQAP